MNWMLEYKEKLQKQFKQIEIYVSVTELVWL